MPRPTRIEYENAFYHIMNRGRVRQTIFHNNSYYLAFLETLEEASQRFNAVIHAYCLMSNHYHLIVETPLANISRVMRHVNGVYTQRYSRLKKTDGPLFLGRFKAILVDEDAYLLQLSRYIHRKPVETKKPVENLEQSSPVIPHILVLRTVQIGYTANKSTLCWDANKNVLVIDTSWKQEWTKT